LFGSTKWIVPAAVLVLMPKCPLCLVAYIALATGVGVSLGVAAWIRGSLLAICIAALAYLFVRAAAGVLRAARPQARRAR
jgi:hypothetical protein